MNKQNTIEFLKTCSLRGGEYVGSFVINSLHMDPNGNVTTISGTILPAEKPGEENKTYRILWDAYGNVRSVEDNFQAPMTGGFDLVKAEAFTS